MGKRAKTSRKNVYKSELGREAIDDEDRYFIEADDDSDDEKRPFKAMDLNNEDASDSKSESESESDSDVRLSEPSKTAIYNMNGLLDKLGDIAWPKNLNWFHKLSIDIEQAEKVDVNDDLAREMAFYSQALEGTKQAMEKFQAMGRRFLRPVDYHAEMVKPDAHMEEVKGRVLAEKREIEEAEERRKAIESERISKEVQSQKQKERAKLKKDEIGSVKKWRKQRQQSGFADEDEEFSLERNTEKRPGVRPLDRSGGRAHKKRESKDSKFGFGGRKGLGKQNTAETNNGFRAFKKTDSPSNNKRKR